MVGDRISTIIKYKAKNKKEFAAVMGWSPTYLSKLLSNQSGIGITPIIQILDKFPDIDARWLLFGEGYIFGSIEKIILQRIDFLLSLERFIPVMNEEELNHYIEVIQGYSTYFDGAKIIEWEMKLSKRNNEKESIIKQAMLQNSILQKINNQTNEHE